MPAATPETPRPGDATRPAAVAAVDIDEHKRVEQALRASEARLAFLMHLNDVLRSRTRPEDMCAEATRLLAEHLDVERVGYAEDVGDGVHVEVTRDHVRGVPSLVGRYRYDDYGPIMQELRGQRTSVRPDLANDPTLTAEERSAWTALGIGALVHVAPAQAGDLNAILFVHTTKARNWTPTEVALIEDVAARTAADVLRLRAEQALARSEEWLRLSIDGANIGTWYWTMPGSFRQWSERCKVLLALPPGKEPSVEHFFSVIHPDDRERVRRMISDATERRGDYNTEYRIVHPDGSIRWASALGQAYFNTDGSFRGMGGIMLDITERKRSEETLRALMQNLETQVAERTAQLASTAAAKSEFLAHMSHEIRTPMNGVLGLTQLLLRESLTSEQDEIVRTIDEAGQSLLRIINDILDFSKIEAGHLRFEEQPYELGAVLTRLEALQRDMAGRKGIDLAIARPPDGLGTIVGDALRLEQVLVNLLNNAIKFTNHGKVELRVTARHDSETRGWLRFEVEDTGPGIVPTAIPTLFDPFVQVGDIARQSSGTGLGLPICKRLVELMGGRIGVVSQPGEGSTFWFEIPFASNHQALANPATPSPSATTGPSLAGLRVLAADDNRVNLLILEKCLQKEGAKVTFAADGQQALQILRAQPQGFDLVLMDLRMPVMDGLAATRAIRADPELATIPVLALTAGVMPEERAKAMAAGVDNFLTKPLDLEQMVHMLATIRADRLRAQ